MTKKRSSKVTVKVLAANAYYRGSDPVKAGTKIQVSKQEAAKLIGRGLAEEA